MNAIIIWQVCTFSDVEQCGLLLGETGEPEQSDTDELELQLAALIESQQTGYVTDSLPLQCFWSFISSIYK